MIKKIISQITIDKNFLKNSYIVFGGNLLVSIFTFFFRVFSGRLLGPESYGTIGFLIALLSILQIISFSINNAVTKYTAISLAKNNLGEITYIFKKLNIIAFLIGLVIFVIAYLISDFLSIRFKIDSIYIKCIAISFIFIFANSVIQGIFQGKKLFGNFCLMTIVESIAKIFIFFMLFYLGFGIKSAIYAIVGAVIVSYLFGRITLVDKLAKNLCKIKLKSLFKYFSIAFLSLGIFSLIAYIDIPLAKYYLNKIDAGYYTAISDIGKIIFYTITPILTVMFSVIAGLFAKNKKHYHILAQTMLLIFVLSLPALMVYYFYPQWVIKLLYGQQYLEISKFLFKSGFAMLILVFCNTFVLYFLSIKEKNIYLFIITSIILLFILFKFYHGNINQIINNLIYSYLFLLSCFIGLYFFYKKNKIKQIITGKFSTNKLL